MTIKMARNIFTTFFLLLIVSASQAWADSLVVIVNKENPVSSLSVEEARRFFLLNSKIWPSGGKIKPINRNKSSAVKKSFISSILKMTPEDYEQHWIYIKQKSGETEPKTVRSNKFVLKIVGKDTNAVGYLPENYFNTLEASSKNRIKAVLKVK
jgi:ABC-type phosphate transport system substrate-binding protein